VPQVNLTVLCGECSTPAELRMLESGTRVAALAVRCPLDDGHVTSIPVTVWEPAGWVAALDAGDPVVVVGRLRRRFFQRPGGVGSRVDVEAAFVAPGGDRRRLRAAIRRAHVALEPLDRRSDRAPRSGPGSDRSGR
jgi:hypothetical protein